MHKTKVSLGLVGLYQISYVIDSNNGTRNYATIRKKKSTSTNLNSKIKVSPEVMYDIWLDKKQLK